jgi:hypothetical protein
MPKRSSDYLYVAAHGALAKIGISSDPKRRVKNLGRNVRLVTTWHLPDGLARLTERCVRFRFIPIGSHAREWFTNSPEELVEYVERVLPRYTKEQIAKAVKVSTGTIYNLINET